MHLKSYIKEQLLTLNIITLSKSIHVQFHLGQLVIVKKTSTSRIFCYCV